jgi:hypothetical protein
MRVSKALKHTVEIGHVIAIILPLIKGQMTNLISSGHHSDYQGSLVNQHQPS